MILLVTNGPRTGKYGADKKPLPVHQENSDIDLVSKEFLNLTIDVKAS
ncbi:MAG: hypothetical protein RCO49_05945 [Rickettsia endosymbiont of Argas persicus]